MDQKYWKFLSVILKRDGEKLQADVRLLKTSGVFIALLRTLCTELKITNNDILPPLSRMMLVENI